jgi:hypothetical protein
MSGTVPLSTSSLLHPSSIDSISSLPSSGVAENYSRRRPLWRPGPQRTTTQQNTVLPVAGLAASPATTELELSNSAVPTSLSKSAGLFHTEARFEGYVLECKKDVIVAHITERAGGSGEFLTVEIPVNDVSPYDRPLAKAGATFYWLIGFEEKPYWKRSLILTFAGHKRLTSAEIRARENELLDLLNDV